MNTTSIFFEILVVGIQASLWIFLGLGSFDIVPLKNMNFADIKEWLTLLLPVLFCLCYTLGIVIDRLADALCMLYSPEKNLFKIEVFRKMKLKVLTSNEDVVNLRIQLKEGQLSKYFSYIKSRLRVLRGTTLNLLLLTIFSLIYFFRQEASNLTLSQTIVYSALIIIGGTAATIVTWISVALIQFSYRQRQKEVENLL